MKAINKKMRKILSIVICLGLVMSYAPMASIIARAADDVTVTIASGESVTLKDTDADDYYEIGNANELYAFVAIVNGGNNTINAELTADIDLNPGYTFNANGTVTYNNQTVTEGFASWIPVGSANNSYAGTFDGADLTISGLYYNGTDVYSGMFAYMSGVVKNLNLTNTYVESKVTTSGSKDKSHTAGIAAYSNGEINNCSFTGAIVNTTYYIAYAGGIVAENEGSVFDCVNYGSLNIKTTNQSIYSGGVIGRHTTEDDTIKISGCYNEGTITSISETYGYSGGIIGYMTGGILSDCYNIGDASIDSDSGGGYSGGIAGFINRDTLVTRSTNKDCNIVAKSSAYAYGGGIVGQSYGNISECYSIGATITSKAYYYRAHSSGVVGFVDEGSVEGCYAIGTLKTTGGKTQLIGGVVSYITPAVTLKDNWYCTDDASCGVAFMYETEESNFEVEGGTAGMPRESFANGEIAYLLGEPYGQNLDNGEVVQDYPVLDGAKVYCGYKACGEDTVSYSNYPLYETIPDHSFENGFCTVCDICEEPQTIEGVYQLANAGNLFWFAKHVNENDPAANAVLVADIDLENREWTPIGNATTPYTGLFDGQNYKITNLKMTINEPSNSNGFFGVIKNTTVKNFSIDGNVTVNLTSESEGIRYGSIAAAALSTDADVCIQNIHSSVNVTFNGGYSHQVGGLVGYAEGGTTAPWYKVLVEGCSYSGTLDLSSYYADCAGGIVAYIGYNNYVKIMGCKFDGAILCTSETGGQIGGIFGYNRGRNMYMQNCLSIGEIEIANPKTTGALAGRYLVTAEGTFFTTPHAYNNYYNVGELPGFANVTDTSHGYYNIDIVDYPGYEEYKDTIDVKVTEEQLASGEIAYKLGSSWGQLIGADATPVIGGTKVYCGYTACSDTTVTYSNTELSETIPEHSFDANGLCTACGAYEEPQAIEGVYQLANAGNLLWFSDYVNNGNYDANAVLLADIEMNGIKWLPMATTQGYVGTFDGKGYSINNLWHNTGVGNGNRDGLFIRVGSEGKVMNLTLNNPTIWGASHSGSNAVAGIANLNAGTISGCMIIGGEIQQGNYEYLGGIAGHNQSGGIIENCAVLNVTFQRRWGGASSGTMGGITQTNNGTVRNCYTYGCDFANGTAQNSAIVAKGTAGESCYYYTTDTVADTAATLLTAEQFASGEAAWLLNGASADGQWKQSLDTDTYPVLAGATVYNIKDCKGNQRYSNKNEVIHDVMDIDGFCVACGKGYHKPAGEGTAEAPYKIANAGNLFWFARCVNIDKQASANAILIADIDLGGRVWYPIGVYNDVAEENGELVIQPYMGTFDGNGHSISNFVASGSGSQGLIGYTTTNATVKNLGVINATVTGWNAGAVLAYYGTLDNCYVINCTITAYTSSESSVGVYGGAVAGSQAATVKNSFAVDCKVVAGEGVNDKAKLAPVGGKTAENCYYINVTATNGTFRELDGEINVTEEQLKSGEVTWLLQSANTEQIWGQQNNQPGARPVFDLGGLYKVAKVGETDSYSVSNVGDTNGDGILDVNDYQAVVNEVLAEDNEQIGTAAYDDIIRYDIDGDGALDVLDASLIERIVNAHTTVQVYAVGDIDCNGVAFENSDLETIKHLLNNGVKLSTTQKYICDINKDGKASEEDVIVLEDIYGDIEERCGNVIDATYSWSEDFTSCTATGKCAICGSVVTETATAACDTNNITYAAFENSSFTSPKLIVATEEASLSGVSFRKAITAQLDSGDMNLNLVLPAEIDDGFVNYIRYGITNSSVANSTVNLTIYGLETVPYDAFGTRIEYYIDFEERYPLDQLKTVSLPDATTIEVSAFTENKGLESVYAPKVTNIQAVAFYRCDSLAEIYSPNVQVIGQQAFDGCTALTELYFPEVTSVDSYAFSDCTALERAYLPKLTTVSYGVLYGSESLTSLTFGCLKSAYALFMSNFTGSTNIDLTLGAGQKVFENTSGYRWDATDEALQPGSTEFMGCTFKSITIAEA